MEVSILKFIDMLDNIKIFHWKTRSYAEHKASDSLYESLNGNMDKFAEVYLGGENKRFDFTHKKTISIQDHNKKAICSKVKDFIAHLEGLKLPGDLANIREETIANCNQFLYLMSFD